MKLTARDIMTTRFPTLTPSTPLHMAVKRFKEATRETGRRVFGIMVVDADGRLAGMLSMTDILLFMKPKHTQIWGMMDDMDLHGIVDMACDKTRSMLVGDIMTPDVVTVTPHTHVMMLLDLMIKKHVRRLPVLENGQIIGIVYLSDLFYNILDRLTDG